MTDIADGLLARRLGIASVKGRQWDSLGDKAFYLAIIVSFSTQKYIDPVVSWGLLAREIGLYITRVLYVEKLPMLERIRPLTNWHGYFMYVVISLGVLNMYGSINSWTLDLTPYIEVFAYLSLLCGLASIAHFLSLK